MNSVQLMGRLTRDPDIRYTDGGVSICRFGMACDRRFQQEGGQTADFINGVAFGKTAEFVEKYFRKGMKMGLTGRIQTGSYTSKEGQKVYTTDVVAESVEFVESKGETRERTTIPEADREGFLNIPDGSEEELPFP